MWGIPAGSLLFPNQGACLTKPKGDKMDERATWRLLKAIRDLSRLGYPYEEDSESEIDPRLLMALGEITAIAVKALKEYEEGEGLRAC